MRASDAAATKIIVGGFGFNRDAGLAKLVGADYYAGSAREALRIAGKELGVRGSMFKIQEFEVKPLN